LHFDKDHKIINGLILINFDLLYFFFHFYTIISSNIFGFAIFINCLDIYALIDKLFAKNNHIVPYE